MKKIILTLLLITLIFGCDVANDSVDNTTEPGTGVVVTRGKLYDANNVLIGHSVNADERGVLLVTSTGYMIDIKWDGNIHVVEMYYTEADCGGTPIQFELPETTYAKRCYYANNTFYTFRDIVGGVAVVDPSITHYLSTWHTSGTVTNAPGPQYPWGGSTLPLKEITRSELGLPATIAGPLTIKFD